jgi:hypothetical protein
MGRGSFKNALGSCFSLTEFIYGIDEIVILGKRIKEKLAGTVNLYLSFKILMVAETSDACFPLNIDKNSNGKTLIFSCESYVYHKIVEPVVEFKVLIIK